MSYLLAHCKLQMRGHIFLTKDKGLKNVCSLTAYIQTIN